MSPLEEKAPRTKRPFQVARADRESRLNLAGRAFTYIILRVQLDLGVLAGMLMYGLITAIQHSTNRTTLAFVESGEFYLEASNF